MHRFDELVQRGAEFSLAAYRAASDGIAKESDTSGASRLVKALQMLQLQKAVLAVGMFSIFEATVQDALGVEDGFQEVRRRLDASGNAALRERFDDMFRAINVLKHGKGRSYDALVAKAAALPFTLKLPHEDFFSEGDVSEATTLIEVDDAFVRNCAELICDVTVATR